MGIIDIITGFFEKLMSLYQTLKEFLFTEIEIDIVGIEIAKFSVWELLGGGILVTILTIAIIKSFNPL